MRRAFRECPTPARAEARAAVAISLNGPTSRNPPIASITSVTRSRRRRDGGARGETSFGTQRLEMTRTAARAREELLRVKAREEDAMREALGLPPARASTSGREEDGGDARSRSSRRDAKAKRRRRDRRDASDSDARESSDADSDSSSSSSSSSESRRRRRRRRKKEKRRERRARDEEDEEDARRRRRRRRRSRSRDTDRDRDRDRSRRR